MEFFSNLLASLPGAVAQGLIWGLMAIGVYITFKVLDLADLTVDGTMATGGAVCLVLMTHGVNLWVALLCAFLAGMLAGLVTGVLHTFMGIPAILAGILTQLALFSVNLNLNSSQEREECIVHKVNQLIARDSVRVILCFILITGISPIPKPERSRYNRSVTSLKLPFLFLIIKYF